MSLSPHQNSDSQQPDVNSSVEHQAEAFQVDGDMSVVQGDGNRVIQGNRNRAVLGDNNQVVQGDNSQINNVWNIFNRQESVAGTQLTQQEYRNRQALLTK